MTPNNATPPPDADAATTSGFDWQRYKNERRELYEKLTRDEPPVEPPAETADED